MLRSIRWLDRCIAAHKHPERQNLFAIIQGGLDEELRKRCCIEMAKRDTPGIAIGGLSGGEEKPTFSRMYPREPRYFANRSVSLCTDLLPKDRPIYLMGVVCLDARLKINVLGICGGSHCFCCPGCRHV